MNAEITLDKGIEVGVNIGGGGSPAPVLPIVECTQAQYDAMQTHDANTLYAIPEVTS